MPSCGVRRAAVVGLLGVAMMLDGCARHRAVEAPAPAIEVLPVEQTSGTRALLQSVSAVDENIVWVGGHRATWVRTVDGGGTWQAGRMTGADSTLEFRDVYAVSATTAYLLSAGNGPASRIYKTTDAGATWQLQFINRDSSAFFDCFDFWDADHGIAVSDAVNGKLIVITTADGGGHWDRTPNEALPPALAGEGAFAASGTCAVARGRSDAWIGTGAQAGARVYHTGDRGRSWSVVATPIVSGTFSGIGSLVFTDQRNGFALGGRLLDSLDRSDSAVAVTHDAGVTWSLLARPTFSGAVYGGAMAGGVLVAVGPKGLDYSTDSGMHWRGLSAGAYWSVGGAGGSLWAVGPAGRITKLVIVHHSP